jgi:hypothetical protein
MMTSKSKMEIAKQAMTPNIKFLSRIGYHRNIIYSQVFQTFHYNLINN